MCRDASVACLGDAVGNSQELRSRSVTQRRLDVRACSAQVVQHDGHATMKESWPFDGPPDRGVFVSRPLWDGAEPLLFVRHHEDGDWTFLGSTDVDDGNR